MISRASRAAFGEHEPMTSSEPDARATFETRVQSLVGRRILAVDYWDIHNSGDAVHAHHDRLRPGDVHASAPVKR